MPPALRLGAPLIRRLPRSGRRLRDGQNITFTFDNLGRVTFTNRPGSEPDATYAYDNLGRLTSASQTGNALSFTYDALGRNLTQVGPQGTVTSQYDVAGRRTKITYPGSGLYVDRDYLVTGEMTKIRENGVTSGIGVLATLAYDDLGRRTSLTYGNGVVTSYGFDAISRLASLAHNLTGTSNDFSATFTYSPASQIASTTRGADAYAYLGNYNVNRNYTANGLNQYTAAGSTTFTYDARGNLTSDGSVTYGYSALNELTSVSGALSASLGYDPLMRLYQVASSPTSTRFAYDGLAAIAEYDGSNALQRRYVHGPGMDQPLVQYEGSGTSDRRFLAADERGSIVAVTDSSGNLLAANSYDEYGIPGSGNYGRFQYTGQMWLPEVGVYHYKARAYSPTLGRLLQTDPIGYDDGMNVYAYVGNDPVNSIDPFGLTGCDAGTVPVFRPITVHDPEPGVVYAGGRYFCQQLTSTNGEAGSGGFGDGPGGPGIGEDIVVKAPPQKTFQCPQPPAHRPVGGIGTLAAATIVAAKSGLGFGLDIFKAEAEKFSASRYPGLPTSGNVRDASRHFYLSFSMSRMGGAASATQILNAIEVLGGNPLAEQRMDTFNNFVGVSMAQDPAFSGMSAADAFDAALAAACLITTAN